MLWDLVLRHVAECFEDVTQGLVSLPDPKDMTPKAETITSHSFIKCKINNIL